MEKDEAVKRRREVAANHLQTAEFLSVKLDPTFGDSAVLLQVTGFEILLKALRLATTSTSKGGSHNYLNIWLEIPKNVRDCIIENAQLRFVGHTDFSILNNIFDSWQKAFEKFRYSYEVNENRSFEDIELASKNWDNPDFEFYPLELTALCEAINDWLDSNQFR